MLFVLTGCFSDPILPRCTGGLTCPAEFPLCRQGYCHRDPSAEPASDAPVATNDGAETLLEDGIDSTDGVEQLWLCESLAGPGDGPRHVAVQGGEVAVLDGDGRLVRLPLEAGPEACDTEPAGVPTRSAPTCVVGLGSPNGVATGFAVADANEVRFFGIGEDGDDGQLVYETEPNDTLIGCPVAVGSPGGPDPHRVVLVVQRGDTSHLVVASTAERSRMFDTHAPVGQATYHRAAGIVAAPSTSGTGVVTWNPAGSSLPQFVELSGIEQSGSALAITTIEPPLVPWSGTEFVARVQTSDGFRFATFAAEPTASRAEATILGGPGGTGFLPPFLVVVDKSREFDVIAASSNDSIELMNSAGPIAGGITDIDSDNRLAIASSTSHPLVIYVPNDTEVVLLDDDLALGPDQAGLDVPVGPGLFRNATMQLAGDGRLVLASDGAVGLFRIPGLGDSSLTAPWPSVGGGPTNGYAPASVSGTRP